MIQKRAILVLAVAGLTTASLLGCSGGGSGSIFGQGKSQDLPVPAGSGWYVAGAMASQKGNNQAAEEYLGRALKENPDLITARSLLGDLYRERGAYGPATQQYEVVAKLDPYGWKNFFNLGVCYQFLGQMEDSVRNYVKSLRIEPKQPEANANVAMAYLAMGRVEEAVSHARTATEQNPKSASAWANLGLALDTAGQHEEAESAYRTSLELDSDATSTLLNFSGNLIAQKKPADAAEILQKVIAKSDSPFARKRLGDALLASGNVAGAREQYEKSLLQNSRYILAMNALAELNIAEYEKGLRLDDTLRDNAVAWWKKSLAIQPQQPSITSKVKRWEKVDLFGN